jgi:hypothetical protein
MANISITCSSGNPVCGFVAGNSNYVPDPPPPPSNIYQPAGESSFVPNCCTLCMYRNEIVVLNFRQMTCCLRSVSFLNFRLLLYCQDDHLEQSRNYPLQSTSERATEKCRHEIDLIGLGKAFDM